MFYVQDQRVISDNCDHQTAGPADSRNMINYGMKETVLFALAGFVVGFFFEIIWFTRAVFEKLPTHQFFPD